MGYNCFCDNRRQQVSRFAGIIRVAGLPAEGGARGFLMASAAIRKMLDALASLLSARLALRI
jgi:hypothetical protein